MAKRPSSFGLPSTSMRVEYDEIEKRHPFTMSQKSLIAAGRGRGDSSLPLLQNKNNMHDFDLNYTDMRASSFCRLTSSVDDISPYKDNKNNTEDQRLSENMRLRSSDHGADYSHIVPDKDDHYDLQHHNHHTHHHDHYYYSLHLPQGAGIGADATAPGFTSASKFDDSVVLMINSKTSNSFSVKRLSSTDEENIPVLVPASDYKHSVVPCLDDQYYCTSATHDRKLLASEHHGSDPTPKLAVPNNENAKQAEAEAAIVPSLSDVCSNDLPYPCSHAQDQNHQSACRSQSVEDQNHDQQAHTNKFGTSRSTSSKRKYARTRTSEVHTSSERKRRDKMKKRMGTLQRLIPNCNKVDKASILDEAIVYVKTLQLQLQMMSMGVGLMPPMMVGNGTVGPHLSYMPLTSAATPTFQLLAFAPAAAATIATASFVPLVAPSLLAPHPSISLSTSMNSTPSHPPKHDQHQPC